MGKPFDKELGQLQDTAVWANSIDLSDLQKKVNKFNAPVYIVGSGGSLSACYYAADLFISKGIIAKAITPLELHFAEASLRKVHILFISASGKNTDILFGFKKAVAAEPLSITAICMRRKTKIAELAKGFSNSQILEYECPAGKDGFLATNSLVAYYIILYRIIINQNLTLHYPVDELAIVNFVKKLPKDVIVSILYSNYAHSIAVDIESKFTEAGLGATLLSDYRNFAHGRHNWFDKRKNSAIITLTTPWDDLLAKRTLALLPKSIPVFNFSSDYKTYESAIHLLIQSFYLAKVYGNKVKINPGKPGVPDYGSKIYNLKYERLINLQTGKRRLSQNIQTAILRKTKVNGWDDLMHEKIAFWTKACQTFIKKIESSKFGALIFDYDGTLCSSENRFNGLSKETGDLLLLFLKKGFVIGIVSGRGKSLRTDLDKIFTKETKNLKDNVIIGYYNGSDIALLKDDTKPDKTKPLHPSLAKIKQKIESLSIVGDESPNQLTFGAKDDTDWQALKAQLLQEIMLLNLMDIQMVESSHSIDIIPREEGNKNHIIEACRKKCTTLGIDKGFLVMGDKGQWPGNDYALLANECSLSVGEVSPDPNTCWNICPPGVQNVEGITYLFGKIRYAKGYFTMKGL